MINRNPFATKFIRAGALPFVFEDGQSIESLHQRLVKHQWRGQIVGPHGSGKTTLLRMLDSCWSNWERESVLMTAQNGQRSIPLSGGLAWNERTQVIVDGYEQLGVWMRLRLHTQCRLRKSGLLVTTHARVRSLPVLYETRTTLELAKQLATLLIAEDESGLLADLECELNSGLYKHNGNLRETFLHLYDVYDREKRTREPCR